NSSNITNSSWKDSSKSPSTLTNQASSNSAHSNTSNQQSSTTKNTSQDKPKSSISDKLGKNGKLTGEEQEHCMREQLCLYCGEEGHVAGNWPKSKAAKAHASADTATGAGGCIDLTHLAAYVHLNVMESINPIGLQLFDGSCNSTITQIIKLPVTFPAGEVFNLSFYVTSLDSSCSAVLGHSWLKQYNPLIDWSSSQLAFCSADHRGPAPLTSPLSPNLLVEILNSSTLSETPIPPKFTTPDISFINAAAYVCASKLPGAVAFQMTFAPEGLSAHSTQSANSSDLSDILPKYHKFADVFNKTKADTL
ncbi:hypothetical protein L208DRAFT_1053578, partial [Tricholoma matsutake]